MKICIFSDLHIHPWQEFATVDERGINARLLDTLAVIAKVRKISEKRLIEMMVKSNISPKINH